MKRNSAKGGGVSTRASAHRLQGHDPKRCRAQHNRSLTTSWVRHSFPFAVAHMSLTDFIGFLADQFASAFLWPGSLFSLTSLMLALVVATCVIAGRRRGRGRHVKSALLMRMLFPRGLFRSATVMADLLYFAFNIFAFATMFGWAILSYQWLGGAVEHSLVSLFGPVAPSALPDFVKMAIATLTIFIAYEFGYWVDHYLSHSIPALWEIHKVHHAAETLTPLTVWRVHPVEMIKFTNILAISTATAKGVSTFAFGGAISGYMIHGTNALLIVFVHLYLHLQHSSVWIAFPGMLGRIFMSPAHHQIHHSMDPKHFNRNLGSCLSVFDNLFGTLYAPSRTPEKLRFGVEGEGANAHAPSRLFITPVIRSLASLIAGRSVAPVATTPAASIQSP